MCASSVQISLIFNVTILNTSITMLLLQICARMYVQQRNKSFSFEMLTNRFFFCIRAACDIHRIQLILTVVGTANASFEKHSSRLRQFNFPFHKKNVKRNERCPIECYSNSHEKMPIGHMLPVLQSFYYT